MGNSSSWERVSAPHAVQEETRPLAAGRALPRRGGRPGANASACSQTGGALHSPGNADWAADVNEARQRAAAQGKFVFIEFDRTGCGGCRRMDTLLYPAFDFEALLIPMVPVKVMIDTNEGRELAVRHGVEEVPAVLIESPEGRQVLYMQGFTPPRTSTPTSRARWMCTGPSRERSRRRTSPRISAREALDTGKELYGRGDSASALPRLKRAVAAPGGTAVLREDAMELLAAVQLDGGDPAGSRQTINRLIETTKDNGRRERAELFRAQIPLSENKPEEAYALFLKFEKDHPKSPYLEQVRKLIGRMSSPPPKP